MTFTYAATVVTLHRWFCRDVVTLVPDTADAGGITFDEGGQADLRVRQQGLRVPTKDPFSRLSRALAMASWGARALK